MVNGYQGFFTENKVLINSIQQLKKERNEYASGTKEKILRDENGAKTVLLKMPEGFHVDSYCPITTEQHFVLEGEYASKDAKYPAGSYQIFYARETDGPFESANGALMLVVWDPYNSQGKKKSQ